MFLCDNLYSGRQGRLLHNYSEFWKVLQLLILTVDFYKRSSLNWNLNYASAY